MQQYIILFQLHRAETVNTLSAWLFESSVSGVQIAYFYVLFLLAV